MHIYLIFRLKNIYNTGIYRITLYIPNLWKLHNKVKKEDYNDDFYRNAEYV